MNRTTRTLIVVGVAVALASAATYLVFVALMSRPAKEVEIAHAYAVVAAKPLPLGTLLKADDVKVVPWPAANQVPGGFTAVEQVVDRGVISPLEMNEPLTEKNIAGKESGAGLPPTIPPGMRALSVRVNDVVGVAGFVVPSTRVDVMVILRETTGNLARVVVSNVQVLTAGTRTEQDTARDGKAIPSTVVTLLVSPEDAAKISLAQTEGQIMLTLRNPLDTAPASSAAVRSANLRGDVAPAPAAPARPRPAAAAAPKPAPPPPPPQRYTVETIRAAKRTEETIK